MTQRISLADKAANINSEENKSAQPLFGARSKNLFAISPAAFLLDKQVSVEEKTIQEKSQEKVHDKTIEKSQEEVLEKVQEKILGKKTQEQAQEKTQGLYLISKQLQVEKEDMQKSPLAAEHLQMEQETSKAQVQNVGQSDVKRGKTYASIPAAVQSEKNKNTEPLTRTTYSSPSKEFYGLSSQCRFFFISFDNFTNTEENICS